MLEHYFDVSPAVQKHSRTVAGVARRLGAALSASGRSLDLDLDLLTAAGLLHDVCKGQEDHARQAAAWLQGNGFPEVAAVVAVHTDILWKEGDRVDERALVYLADRIVEEEQIVTLAERKAGALRKYGADETVRQRITARFEAAEKIQAAVEETAGLSFIRILGPSGK